MLLTTVTSKLINISLFTLNRIIYSSNPAASAAYINVQGRSGTETKKADKARGVSRMSEIYYIELFVYRNYANICIKAGAWLRPSRFHYSCCRNITEQPLQFHRNCPVSATLLLQGLRRYRIRQESELRWPVLRCRRRESELFQRHFRQRVRQQSF